MNRKPEIKSIDAFINGTPGKEVNEPMKIPSFKKNKKFPLEIAPELDEMINTAVSTSPFKITKHDWIITAIIEKIQKSN